MRIQPTITFEQFRNTCEAVTAAKGKRVQPYSWKGYLLLGVVCLVLGLAPQVPVARIPALTLDATMILFWIMSKPYSKWCRNRCLRKLYDEEQSMLDGQVLTVDESGIACDLINGHASSHHTWRAFTKRIEMPDAFVFLSSPNHFIRIPKETLPSSDCDRIRQWSSTIPTSDGD